MKVVRYLNNGSTRISLVDKGWIPISYHSTIFLNISKSGSSTNTKQKIAYELKFFLSWLKLKKIDLVERVEQGEYLSLAECNAFNQAAKIRADTVLSEKVSMMNPLSDKHLSNAIFAESIERARVAPSVTNSRIITTVEYIDFISREVHGLGRTPDFVESNLNSTIDKLMEGKRKHSSAARASKQAKRAESPIPNEIFYKFLDIINPESPENPFKHSKLRNSLIIKILVVTGIRRGAVAKLKISDCVFTGDSNRIRITRTPDDKEDFRTVKPSQKTVQHTSYVDPELMGKIDYYISSKRSRYPESAKHEFVFISEMDSRGTDGDPLSLSSINYLFKVLSRAINFNVHPHLLRHKWNEMFSEDTSDLSSEEASSLRKYAMGWGRNSDMAELYNRFKMAQKVSEVQQKRQAEIMSRTT
ncbi:site-specific integrase [Agarivorans sp. DSG3-1]|uniref:site-specific integrase n=1 Tax=Agarivorans sp. DSG3-1 TaxID=3342249 RepID=UPI00398E465C